jgi:hypothetical protein
MVTYLELEETCNNWHGEICVFGAGKIGKGMAYELLKAAGIGIDFYCDNYVALGTVVRDGIKIKPLQYLYDNKENVKVFVAVSELYQDSIISQLQERGVGNLFLIDRIVMAQILESVDRADDSVKAKYYALYDDKEYLAPKFEESVGYALDFQNPRTFNAKLQWLKLYNHNPLYTTMVDKLAVKSYVADQIGKEYVIPSLGAWDKFEDIDFTKLPEQFVLKCTHDSGSVVLVEAKESLDYEAAKKKLDRALSINYFWMGREWPYKNAQRKIMAEPYMEKAENMIDYKFLCFHGEPKMIFTCTERFEPDGLKVTFFDLNWKKQNFERHYPASSKRIEKPGNLELMIKLAKKLSEGIPFVRVDFYEINGDVYFGEMTFFPGGGMEEFEPKEWDGIMGDWIKLPTIAS